MTPSETETLKMFKKDIIAILEAPSRSQMSTSDIRIPYMSSTRLGQVVSDLSNLIHLARADERKKAYDDGQNSMSQAMHEATSKLQ